MDTTAAPNEPDCPPPLNNRNPKPLLVWCDSDPYPPTEDVELQLDRQRAARIDVRASNALGRHLRCPIWVAGNTTVPAKHEVVDRARWLVERIDSWLANAGANAVAIELRSVPPSESGSADVTLRARSQGNDFVLVLRDSLIRRSVKVGRKDFNSNLSIIADGIEKRHRTNGCSLRVEIGRDRLSGEHVDDTVRRVGDAIVEAHNHWHITYVTRARIFGPLLRVVTRKNATVSDQIVAGVVVAFIGYLALAGQHLAVTGVHVIVSSTDRIFFHSHTDKAAAHGAAVRSSAGAASQGNPAANLPPAGRGSESGRSAVAKPITAPPPPTPPATAPPATNPRFEALREALGDSEGAARYSLLREAMAGQRLPPKLTSSQALMLLGSVADPEDRASVLNDVLVSHLATPLDPADAIKLVDQIPSFEKAALVARLLPCLRHPVAPEQQSALLGGISDADRLLNGLAMDNHAPCSLR